MKKIHHYNDFIQNLQEAGFSVGGENSEGIFTLCSLFGNEIHWHTEEPDSDPWEWRMRVLDERADIAYGKFFFKKSGYITREWYPYFYAARRGKAEFLEEYEAGTISQYGKRIYKLVEEYKELPLHLIKQYGGFGKEDKAGFDRALTELQMNFYITMCGRARKRSKAGEEYGWSSTVFCLADEFFEKEVTEAARQISFDEAFDNIEEQIHCLNPDADARKIKKFITG